MIQFSDAYDPSHHRVVRRGRFHTDEVSGLSVWIPMTDNGKVRSVLCTFYVDAEGQRHAVEKPQAITLDDDTHVQFHDSAWGMPPARSAARWSPKSANEWLQGGSGPCPRELYRRLREALVETVYLGDETHGGYDVIALYLLLSYVQGVNAMPYLHFKGPPGCGKTTALKTMAELAFSPIVTADTSPAALFRSVDVMGGTVILDEAEGLSGSGDSERDIAKLLRLGHTAGQTVRRCNMDRQQTEEFDVFSPKVLGSIEDLDRALSSRCIRISMVRRPRSMTGPSTPMDWQALRDDIHRYVMGDPFALVRLARNGPPRFADGTRDGDLWRPLFGLAYGLEQQGCEGIQDRLAEFQQREAESRKHDDDSANIADAVFKLKELREQGKTPTAGELLTALKEESDAWESLSPRKLANELRAFGICTHKSGRRVYDISVGSLDRVIDAYGLSAD